MRKLYTFLTAAMLAFGATAQTTVFFDDFESNSLEGYTLHNVDGLTPDDPDLATMADSAWTIKSISAMGSKAAFSVSWYVNDEGPSDDWLVTPPITIAGDAKLEWRGLAITSSTFRDRYQVYITNSADLEEILNDETTTLVFDTQAQGENATVTERIVDLAAAGFANQTIYVAFRNWTQPYDPDFPGGNGNGGNELAIDDVKVTDNSVVASTRQSDIFSNATVQPNPASGSYTHVSFTLERSENVFVELIDLTGKVVSSENRGILAAGNHMYEVSRKGLPAGIYLLRLRTGDKSHVMRVAFQ